MRLRLLCIALLGSGSIAQAEDGTWMHMPGVPSVRIASGARAIVRQEPPPLGLETGLPGDGAYARAIQLDATDRISEALHEYTSALAELDGLDGMLAPSETCAAHWRARILWQREVGEHALEEQAYLGVLPSSTTAHTILGDLYRAKFLAVRAFVGAGPRALWDAARTEYERALDLDESNRLARVGLASLWADAGDDARAHAEFVQLGRHARDPALAVPVAAFFAAAGEPDAALDRLASTALKPEERRMILRSNLFDSLRADPRFRALFPSPIDEPLLDRCTR